LDRQLDSFAARVVSDPAGFLTHLNLIDVAGLAAAIALLWTGFGMLNLALGVLIGWGAALWRRVADRNPWRRHPAREALRDVAGQHLRQIRFLQTHTSGWSGKVSAPMSSELGLSRSLARAEQPWTHPEVVQRLRDFLDLVVEVLVTGTHELSGIVLAIDELDKISDPEDAHRFLNEIKGIFGIPHCLYLV